MNLKNLFGGKKAKQPKGVVATPVVEKVEKVVESVEEPKVKKAKSKRKNKTRYEIEKTRRAMCKQSRKLNRGTKGHSRKR